MNSQIRFETYKALFDLYVLWKIVDIIEHFFSFINLLVIIIIIRK